MSALESFPTAFRRLDGLARCDGALVLLGAAGLSVALWPAWRHNPDLTHGLFLPLVFLILLGESRSLGPHRYLSEGPLTTTLTATATVIAVLCLGLAGLYAAVLDWDHALVQFLLSAALAAFLGAALFVFASERRRLIPLNWASLVAVGLWLFAAPIPPGSCTRLTLALQLRVSSDVLLALHWLGIPAVRSGNILQLAGTTVGVEEACSGVRSLVSCIFVALFFSATLVSRPAARLVLLLLAAPLALFMNFLRSLALTLMANANLPISGFWHDLTGYSVLVVTGAVLGAIAVGLGKSSDGVWRERAAGPAHPGAERTGPRIVALGLILALGLGLFCYRNTRAAPAPAGPGPDLNALLPAPAPGWTVVTAEQNLNLFAQILHAQSLAQRGYVRTDGAGPKEITFYLAYWHPGEAPVSLVASHTPDACWPGAGWHPVAQHQTRIALPLPGGRLPAAEQRVFRNGSWDENVWFWHLYGGHLIVSPDPYSIGALARIALRYGFLHNGDQLFVRVSSNRPWREISTEPLVQQFFAELSPLGLTPDPVLAHTENLTSRH